MIHTSCLSILTLTLLKHGFTFCIECGGGGIPNVKALGGNDKTENMSQPFYGKTA